MSSSLEVGIIGLPNVGKSTVFNAITKAGAEAANYPFSTREPNVGVVVVPDKRLDVLAGMHRSKKIVPTAIRFVDIAGLAKGASTGEGLGNKFLAHIREVDAVAHVVRCFEDGGVAHVEGSLDPVRDIEIINMELCLADIEAVDRRLERLGRLIKSGDKTAALEKPLLEKLREQLENAVPARRAGLNTEEKTLLKELNLLTLKPTLYIANIGENDVTSPLLAPLRAYAADEGAQTVVVPARLEEELVTLEEAEALEFLASAGLAESSLDRLIKSAYELLDLISFLTTGPDESRAWTIRRGIRAPQAAGKIHSDIERGFIRAEIVAYDDLIACGSHNAAKEKGLVRLEGKEYIMKDGDVTNFRFNV